MFTFCYFIKNAKDFIQSVCVKKVMAAEESDIKITDLNNDCLIQIFNHLDYPDLLNVRKANSAFHDAVESVCRLKKFEFNIKIPDLEHLKVLQAFLSLYGVAIKKSKIRISLHRDASLDDVNLVIASCSQANISHCSLNNLHLIREFLAKNSGFLKSLESLTVHFSGPLFEFLDTSIEVPENLTLKHLGLKVISLGSTAILEKFPNITHLEIELNKTNSLSPILHLNKLKYLKLHTYDFSTPQFNGFLLKLAQRNMLESLWLLTSSHWTLELETTRQIAHSFCQMTNLKELKLQTNLKLQPYFSKFCRSLVNLQSFQFLHCHVGNQTEEDKEQNFQMGLELVTKAKNLTFLCLHPLHRYKAFYDKVVEIRSIQGNNEILFLQFVKGRHEDTTRISTSADQEKFVKGNSNVCNLLKIENEIPLKHDFIIYLFFVSVI